VLFAHYGTVKRSAFDDTFIYLHIAQNAIESGTWQYFPATDRPALLASSPLRITVLTAATAIVWPFTDGTRSIEAAFLILPISALLTALIFLPFWWRDRARYLIVCVPYAIFAATLETPAEFEGGLLYGWIVTLMRDFIERKETFGAALVIAIGPLIRPDMAIIVFTALAVAHLSRGTFNRALLRRVVLALALVLSVWIALCVFFDVWPIPTTYWTKSALPKLFDASYVIAVLSPRLAQSAFGAFAQNNLVNHIVSLSWLALLLALAMSSKVLPRFRWMIVVLVSAALLARMPSNFWWYYQNFWMMGAAVAVAVLLFRSEPTNNPAQRINSHNLTRLFAAALVALSISAVLGRTLREPAMLWHFDQPSRVQGYLAMAKSFDEFGQIELPELGRGYLRNPEIGITSYFARGRAWIWDSAGLAQAHPQAQSSKLRWLYPRSLRALPAADIARLTTSKDVVVFEAWATEHRDPSRLSACKYVLLDNSLCVTAVDLMSVEQATHQKP
jgi:hypothetical protein